MVALWERWGRFTGRRIDARPLVLVRIFVPLCVLGDLVDMALRGALDACLYSAQNGGVNANFAPQLAFDPNWVWLGPILWLVCVASMALVSAGIWTRPALAIGLVSTSQLGHFFMPGDRGIDRLLRTALLILLFSEVTSSKRLATVAAWPVDLLKWILVLVYMAAGFAKIGGSEGWFFLSHQPELYRILADPMAGKLDPAFWAPISAPFRFGSWATIVLEVTAPLILTRWCHKWALFGAFMHLGIAAMMFLGMFSWGMLAFYPLLFSPWTEQVLDRFGLTLGLEPVAEDAGAS